MDETELGQSAHALPQLPCFWWIRSGMVKNFRTGLVQVHRRSQNFGAGLKSGNWQIYPTVAKEGEAVVRLLRTLGNTGSGVLRLSRRVTNMAIPTPASQIHVWLENQLNLAGPVSARISLLSSYFAMLFMQR
jgi:hypothetical protein